MGGKELSKKNERDRAENWELFKFKTMTDAMVQMRTLAKYKNYNKINWNEPKSLCEEYFTVVRAITLASFDEKGMTWFFSTKQMMAKQKTARKQYKASAKKANKTRNSNEQKMELLKDFPIDMGMLISKHSAGITTPGKMDSSANDKKPNNVATKPCNTPPQ